MPAIFAKTMIANAVHMEIRVLIARTTTGMEAAYQMGHAENKQCGKENRMKLSEEEFGTLAICAIRYCHGRQTYMPDLVRDIVRPHLTELSGRDLNVMLEDCDFQERMHMYGDERIDKPGWLKWKEELTAEKERRTE